MPADPKKVITGNCVINFAHVFTPRAASPGAEQKYSAMFILDKTTNKVDLDRLVLAAYTAGREKWRDFDTMAQQRRVRLPFRDGAEKEGQPGFGKNKIFINCSSQQRPGVVDANVQPIMDPKEIYSGAVVRASVRAFAYDQAGNKGVSFGLQHVQKVADGEAIGNWSKPEDDFQPVDGGDGGGGAPPLPGAPPPPSVDGTFR